LKLIDKHSLEMLTTLQTGLVLAIPAVVLGKTLFPGNVTRPSGDYYQNISTYARDEELKYELQKLVFPHTELTYDEVWEAFKDLAKHLPGYPCSSDPDHIPDVYSSYCWVAEKGLATGGQCGNYQEEGDCFNREHGWPKSWFGGMSEGDGAQTDLFELWPTDGYVNGLRGNLPLGDVVRAEVDYESSNGCLVGACVSAAYRGRCFEVTDVLKGDFARSYFYLSTVYERKWDCCEEAGTDSS
jgi:endonuclease I